MKRILLLLTGGLVALAVVLAGLATIRPVNILIDDAPLSLHTLAPTAGWALYDAGVELQAGDVVEPTADQFLGWQAQIKIHRPRPVYLYLPGQDAPKQISALLPVIPADILQQAGTSLAEGDRILWNGSPVEVWAALPAAAQYVLQVQAAQSASLSVDGKAVTVRTLGSTYGSALWAAGIHPGFLDALSARYDALLEQATFTLRSARPITVTVDGHTISGSSAAEKVGQALAELDIPLQGLDRSVPAESEPIPADGGIRVVRVREEIVLNQVSIPFKSETVADPTLDLDQTRLAQVGQVGIQVTRQRVRYEDGKETARQAEGQWTASQPQNQKNAFGTRISIKAIETPDGRVEYYRAVRVYATSFAPCNFIQFIGKCSYSTANGMKLQKGVIGMGEAWYRLFVNQKVYVEGYGFATVADYGYVPGYWIDLGYSDADFVNWHGYTTLYFLVPAPKNVPWVLPK